MPLRISYSFCTTHRGYCRRMLWRYLNNCGVVCISMWEDTHVNILPSPKGLALEMEHNEAAGLVGWSWVGQASARGVGRLHCCLKTAGNVALHWGPLNEACSSVKPDEAGERIWLNPTEVFVPLIAACCLCWLNVDCSCSCWHWCSRRTSMK
jgi:hypothetical protein